MLGDHLGQNGVAARAHVGGADDQHVRAVVVELDGDRAHVDAGNARALHRHGHARSANFAVAHVAHGVFRFPVEHVGAMLQAAVERARVGDFAEVRGHLHAFAHHILFAQLNGVAAELFGQFVHGGFNGELALRGAEASVGARRLHVRVHHVSGEFERFERSGVQRNGLMAGKADRRPAVLAIGARIRQRGHAERANAAVVVRAQAHGDFHLVARRAAGLRFFARVHAHGGAARFHCDECGVYLAHCGLLCAEAAADAGLFDANAAFWNAERVR